MPSEAELREHFGNLSERELLRLLRSQSLTENASVIAREELIARGVDVAHAAALPAERDPSEWPFLPQVVKPVWTVLRRGLRFPIRAILGVEPLWAVIVFGALGVLLFSRVMIRALSTLVLTSPLPPYALQMGYAILALQALVVGWWAVALWSSAARTRSRGWRIVVRLFAVLCAVQAVSGPMNGVRVLREYIPVPESSVMDLPSKD
jgi:hypothetical protein